MSYINWAEITTDGKPLNSTGRFQGEVTHALAKMSAMIGINNITEQNWKEFWQRTYFFQKINGAVYRDLENNGVMIEPLDVKRHIGLKTNAKMFSFAECRNRIGEAARNDAVRVLNECLEAKPYDAEGDDGDAGE